MDWKDGLTAAAVVGLGYLGIKRVTKGAETFEATQWWNRQNATGHERPSGGYGGFYIQTDYDLGTIKEIFKDWKPKAYPYEKRITQDSFENWCEDCGEIHDEENLIHYQFYLPQSNSRRNRMRYVSGNYCGNDADCGANICESCYENGNQCEECSKIICDTCKEDSEYTTGNTLCYDCWPEEHQAESFSVERDYSQDPNLDLIISIDTSGSTSWDGRGKHSHTILDTYKQIALDSIVKFDPAWVTIYDHNRRVEMVYDGPDAHGEARTVIKNLRSRGGTASLGDVIKLFHNKIGNKLILTDGEWKELDWALEVHEAESFSADMTSHAGKFAFQPARCQICFSHNSNLRDVKYVFLTNPYTKM